VKGDTNETKFTSLRAQFLQHLGKKSIKGFSQLQQPDQLHEALERAMFVEADVANVCIDLDIPSNEAANTLMD
jgi:hypothetical protein